MHCNKMAVFMTSNGPSWRNVRFFFEDGIVCKGRDSFSGFLKWSMLSYPPHESTPSSIRYPLLNKKNL